MTNTFFTRTLYDCVRWGVWLMIANQLLQLTGAIFEKKLLGLYPFFQMTFIRSSVRVVIFFIFILKQGNIKETLAMKQPLCHLIRLTTYVTYNFAILYGLSLVTLTTSCALQYTTPLFTILLSSWILKEKIGKHKWIAVTLSSIAVLIAMQPHLKDFQVVSLIILFATLVGSLNKVLIRRLVSTEHTLSITLFGNAAMVLIFFPAVFMDWHPVSWNDFGYFTIAGVLTAAAQFTAVQALRFAKASTLAPLDYTSIVWAALFDFFVWGAVPTFYLILGTSIIIASNLYLLRASKTDASFKEAL